MFSIHIARVAMWNLMDLYIYMFALRKSVKERFSEGSEAVVLLSVVLSGLPAGIVLLE